MSTQEPQGKLLTMKEAAEHLGVSRRHLESLRNKGELLTVRLGGCVRVRPIDLERMVERHLVGGKGEDDVQVEVNT